MRILYLVVAFSADTHCMFEVVSVPSRDMLPLRQTWPLHTGESGAVKGEADWHLKD